MRTVYFYKILTGFVFLLPILAIAQPKKKVPSKSTVGTTKTKSVTQSQVPSSANAPFQLMVEAKGFKDSTLAIIYQPSNRQYQGPYGFVKSEKVVLQGALPQPDGYGLVFTDNKTHVDDKFFTLFLGNDHSQIAVDNTTGSLTVVSGIPMQGTFDELRTTFGQQFNELNRLGQLNQQYSTNGQPVDSLSKLISQVSTDIAQKVPAFVAKYPSSPVTAFLLTNLVGAIPNDQLLKNIALLKDTAAADTRITGLKDQLEADLLLAEGQPAPLFTQNDTLGKPVSLNSFKGKYVLVDFWASWCRPCRMENPNVLNAYKQYKDKGFTVLGVSLDRDRSNWIQAIHDDGLTWTHVSDLQFWSNAVAQQYRIQSIPQNLLIGPDGKIIAKNLRGGVLHNYLKDLLK